MRRKIPALERFISKVDKEGPIPKHRPELGPCWIWTGWKIKKSGYGGFRHTTHQHDQQILAHRFSYETFIGEIKKGLEIDHLCRNTSCVNPYHLEAVTRLINVHRGQAGPRIKCPHGHLYAGRNLYISPAGARTCRECHRLTEAKRRAKLRLK